MVASARPASVSVPKNSPVLSGSKSQANSELFTRSELPAAKPAISKRGNSLTRKHWSYGGKLQPGRKRKCSTKYCRKPAANRKGGKCHRCSQRDWRRKNPLSDCWRAHKWNAKKRGIPVVWSFEEFAVFCRRTNYLVLRREGMTIHREKCLEGYSTANCVLLHGSENKSIGATKDRWIHQRFRRGECVDLAPDDGSI